MARTIPFIIAAAVFLVATSLLDGLHLSLGQWLFLYAGLNVLFFALVAGAGRLADQWRPALHASPERLILGAVNPNASTDLESEELELDCGYHFALGSGTLEQPWAECPLAWEFSYPQDWVAKLAPLLLNEVRVAHRCEERGNIVRVMIPRLRESGFDVTVEAASFGVLVRAGTLFHAHFPFSRDGDGEPQEEYYREAMGIDPYDLYASREPAEQALGLVRDILSPAVRIRERRAAGIPYYAALETQVRGRWRRRRSVTLLRYSYFGRREERLWSNTHLGPRAAK